MICPSCCHTNLPGDDVCKRCKQPLTLFDLPQADNAVERSVMYDQVNSLKQKSPVVIDQSATISQALALMCAENVGAVLIVDHAGQLLGIFSERDLLKQLVGKNGNDYQQKPITQFMTPRPECVKTTDTLNFVLQKMDAGGYRHVPVLQDGKPVSIVSARDMLRFVTRLCKDPESANGGRKTPD
ncbi:MAG TPA: CBS domain-containing protein [Gemmataceae bacterium]|nr:CBS domain-containing protein [Gemmataceae bacterium]